MYQFGTAHSARNESLGASGGSSTGTTVTASASANAKGSWATIGTTGFAYEQIWVNLFDASANQDFVADIGIDDGAGNVWVLAADLRLDSRRVANEAFVCYRLPLHVPAGSILKARCANSTAAANTLKCIVQGFSQGLMGAPGFSRCIALYTPATSRGVTVDAGGTANTKVRTEIVASSAQRVAGIFAAIGHNADVGRAALASALLDIECGSSGNEFALFKDFPIGWGTLSDNPCPVQTPIAPCDVPAGTRFSAYFQCSDNTAGDRTIDVALYGLVA